MLIAIIVLAWLLAGAIGAILVVAHRDESGWLEVAGLCLAGLFTLVISFCVLQGKDDYL